MSHTEYRKTLNEIFKNDGRSGVISYFVNHEKLSAKDAQDKADAWGYCLVIEKETVTVSNFFSPDDREKVKESFFKRLFKR